MPVQATVFSQALQHLPWGQFARLVGRHGMDAGHRGLDARSHLAALIAGQLIEAHGLRDIEAVMAANAPALRRRRIVPVRRSTLADANRSRPPEAFEALIPVLLETLSPTRARQAKDELRLLDATLIRPGSGAHHWAHFQHGHAAAKVHVVYDPKAQVPVFYEITSANTNDIKVAKASMPIEAGATYVFDLGYYDFGFWAELSAKGCPFVTRLKINTKVTIMAECPVPAGTNIVSDQIVLLPERLARSRKNPFPKAGRMVTVTTADGKHLRLFSNDLNAPAETIAELYKTRWQIELFFRWIKQNLHINRFHGRSLNAVRLQIAAAIITYLLVKILHAASRTKRTPTVFFSTVRSALFLRVRIATLVGRIDQPPTRTPSQPTPQMEFAL
jgi:hypothetical protein